MDLDGEMTVEFNSNIFDNATLIVYLRGRTSGLVDQFKLIQFNFYYPYNNTCPEFTEDLVSQ